MTIDAYEEIRRSALQRIDRAGIDPEADSSALRNLISSAVEDYQRRAQIGDGLTLVDPTATVDRLLRSVSSLGHLSDLLDRSDIEEVFIEGDRVTYLDTDGRLRALEMPTTEQENRQVLERMLAATDRRLDASSPIVQARVLGGTARLTAIIPPISDRVSATIRRYALRRQTLDSLVDLGSLSPAAANFLTLAMGASASILVSGPPGSGKTSFLSALVAAAPPHVCIRSAEEVRELHVPIVHGAYYEARPPSLNGGGEVSLRDLVKMILAMRPDLIVVGEVRGAEAFELTRAANAGCGMAATVHANSAADALEALVNAALMAGENNPISWSTSGGTLRTTASPGARPWRSARSSRPCTTISLLNRSSSDLLPVGRSRGPELSLPPSSEIGSSVRPAAPWPSPKSWLAPRW
jgi:pilus assembly protein CpaF